MKSDELEPLKHPETINGNVKKISKMIEKESGGLIFFFPESKMCFCLSLCCMLPLL